MARSVIYRRFAQECFELARDADDKRTELLFLHMAQVWLRLAQDDEHHDGQTDENLVLRFCLLRQFDPSVGHLFQHSPVPFAFGLRGKQATLLGKLAILG